MRQETAIRIITVALLILCTVPAAEAGKLRTSSRGFSGFLNTGRIERKIHDLVNREREKRGLKSLSLDTSLSGIARKFSADMARRNFFSHKDPEGRGFDRRYLAAGFSCRIRIGSTIYLGAENISQDDVIDSASLRDGKTFLQYRTEDEIARSVVERWMKSKGHRRNILTPYFKREGIGVAVGNDGKVYVTEDFC